MTAYQRWLLATLFGAAVLVSAALASGPRSAGGVLLSAEGVRLAAPGSGGAPAAGIVAGGDATVKAAPDVAILTIGATTQARTAAEAQTALADRVARILQRAKDLRVADADLRNAGYTVTPQYASGPGQAPTITAYQASQTVTITLHDPAAAGRALDTFVQGDGATNVQLRFALGDPKPQQADARRLAIEDAKAKAKAMADAAGVRLGKVLAISESGSGPGPLLDATPLRAAAGTTIPVGDLDVTAHVSVQFAIE